MTYETSKTRVLPRSNGDCTDVNSDVLQNNWMDNSEPKEMMNYNRYPSRWGHLRSTNPSSVEALLQSLGYEIHEVKPYQHVWSGESNIEKTLSLNKKKISEKREKYDQYMEEIGKVSENLLASFDVTKRRALPSSNIYSGLWRADSSYQSQELVDPWAESEAYPTRYKSNYQEYLQNRKWDDFLRNLEASIYMPNVAEGWTDQYGYYSTQKPISTDSYGSLDSQGYENTSSDNYSSGGMDEVPLRA